MRLHIVAFAAGVVSLQFQPEIAPWGGTAACAGLVLLCAGEWRRRAWLYWAALPACFIAGFGWASWRAELRLSERLPAEWEGRDIEVVGVVAAMPQAMGRGSRFEFDVESVLTPGAAVPSRILLSAYPGRHDEEEAGALAVLPGERWRLSVRLRRPHGNANPHGFDYESWLLERGIRASGYVRREPPGERLAEMVWRPGYAVERERHRIRADFLAALPAEAHPYGGILVALAVGDQRAIPNEQWTVFNRSGVTHLISVSGLHITLVAAALGGLLAWAWRRVPGLALRLPAQRAGLLAGWLAAFVYTWLAGFGVPAQRTLYMLSVAVLAMLSGRAPAPGRVLALALLVVLVVDPWAVLAVGFWLSFGAVAALLYVGAALSGGRGDWRSRLAAWGASQWAATLASLPVLLLVFQQFSLVSPFANAVAIPVVSLVVTPLALVAALLPWWPLLALAHAILSALMAFLAWCATWPLWAAPAPPLWAAAAAGCGVGLLLLPRGVGGRWVGALMVLPAVFWLPQRLAPGTAQVTVFDVGHGLAALVRTRGHALLYDPGPLYGPDSDAGQRIVLPHLRATGIDRLDTLVVTHRDSDHAGGLQSILAALPVGEIRSSLPGLGKEPCLAGQSWEWDGVRFAMLHPVAADYAAGGGNNRLSCVLRVEAGDRRLLFGADIEAADEAALLARDAHALSAEVLVVPHHGSRSSSSPAFVAAVEAQEAIFSVGYRNRFGHPRPEVAAAYAGQGARIWRTDRDGAVTVELAADGARVSAWRQERRRYWSGQ